MSDNAKNTAQLKLVQKDTIDIVAKKVREFQERGELNFPANYSPENAMKSAWLELQSTVDRNKRPALEVCTKNSIANTLFNMIVQGLNPAKKQCYFIVYGDSLTLHRSYFGALHLAKTMDESIEEITADVVYEGDEFEFEKKRGKTIISKHIQRLENIDKNKIKAAYCSIFKANGYEDTTVMTFDQIKDAWKQSQTSPVNENGGVKSSSVHGKFTADMAKKTVINRACKVVINSSNDRSLIIKSYTESEAAISEAQAQEEIAANANTIVVDGDTGEVVSAPDDLPQGSDATPNAPAGDDLP